MKKLLNNLFVLTAGCSLHKEGETIVVRQGDEVKMRLPLHNLGGVLCFGNVFITPQLMEACAEHGIGISWLTEHGRFLARMQGRISGNVLLRRAQYRKADDGMVCSNLTRAVLTAKISNARTVVARALRDHPAKVPVDLLKSCCCRLAKLGESLLDSSSVDEMRGIEGEAAAVYFDVFDHLILLHKDEFKFLGRNRRPPRDRVNSLLSFVYTLILHDIRSALESVGLDPFVGFLHKDRPGRPGLALDLLEEFRPMLADRLVLSLINLGQIDADGFVFSDSGAILLNEKTRKEVISAYQHRKQEEIFHPFLQEKIKIGVLFYVQALLLARFFRGDLDGYPSFFWR